MRTAVHGMPRIGPTRELKWALEGFWRGTRDAQDLLNCAAVIREANWALMAGAQVDFIPSNDFSLYDHILDMIVALGVAPARFGRRPADNDVAGRLERYFAMARGGVVNGSEVVPLELTKWFDTNYHQLVAELDPGPNFEADPAKAVAELREAADLGITTTPVLIGPLTFLLRAAMAQGSAGPWDRLEPVLACYAAILAELEAAGARWVRIDEPSLVEDRSAEDLAALRTAYRALGELSERPRIAVSTYFGHAGAALGELRGLPIDGIGLDLCAGAQNLSLLAQAGGIGDKVLFAGVIDGRNVWKADLSSCLGMLVRLQDLAEEVVASTSCSLLHVPVSLDAQKDIDPRVLPWLAFAKEKITELATLAKGVADGEESIKETLEANRAALGSRRDSPLTADARVRQALEAAPSDPRRAMAARARARAQAQSLQLVELPTTTIGSFPQTVELRAARAARNAGRLDEASYRSALESEVDHVISLQEDVGLDVLVHGEPERDDMVRYFAAQLEGFALAGADWVQSYGSRCVRPPVLFGDVRRAHPMSVDWFSYAQSKTDKPVKGMLTGPITMLAWSFVRDDQPPADTAAQIALAFAQEVQALEAAGAGIIQVDEPALRELLPLRRRERPAYLDWATRAIRLTTAAASPSTQVHTHMCYAHFAEIAGALADMEVDVISFEAARSKLAPMQGIVAGHFEGGLGPGTYDVHSPRVPTTDEIAALLRTAAGVLGPTRVWANPDCGLKTRAYPEVEQSLRNLVEAAHQVREELMAQ